MTKPRVIVFDVNETLLDLAPLKASVDKALGGQAGAWQLWFATMLHYSLVETLSGNYHSFGEIGVAALVMVASTKGVPLSRDEAEQAVATPLLSLPPHQDVQEALKQLSADGFRIVALTNSSAEMADTQLGNAGLVDLFEKRYSIDRVRKYKPHPDTYRMVLSDLGVEPQETLMVAAHAWDLAGAKNVGMRTAFVARAGTSLYSNVARPDHVVGDLSELVELLQQSSAPHQVE